MATGSMSHEKYIYSILATEKRKERKKTRSHPPPPILHPYTDTNNTVAHNTVGHQVPSLENWGGGSGNKLTLIGLQI